MGLTITKEGLPMPIPGPVLSLDHLTAWAAPLRRLAGDQRTETLLVGGLTGILGSGRLGCRQIAAFSPSAGRVAARRPPDSAHADR